MSSVRVADEEDPVEKCQIPSTVFYDKNPWSGGKSGDISKKQTNTNG